MAKKSKLQKIVPGLASSKSWNDQKKRLKQLNKKMTLTIRITDAADVALMNELKKLTSEKTVTGALMFAARSYKKFSQSITEREKESSELRIQLQKQNEVLHMLHSSQMLLENYSKKFLGKFPQAELFS